MNFSSIDFWIALGTGLFLIALVKQVVSIFGRGESNGIDRVLLAVLSLSLLFYQSALTLMIFLAVMVATAIRYKYLSK